jgi:hypothetical protein
MAEYGLKELIIPSITKLKQASHLGGQRMLSDEMINSKTRTSLMA